jgi:perosamine synthetase
MSTPTAAVERLALFGGEPAIRRQFARYNPIGAEEEAAVVEVLRSGVLSQFLGAWHPDFYGGAKVREFEAAAAKAFGVKHAVTLNSATSGLIAAIGALGIEPGDEVIVTPWTMSASATAILHWNAIPVFADIEPDTFCIDPASVEANITEFTRAIVAVDIFGQSADMKALRAIARRHGLGIISDSAQAPGARIGNQFAGTLADIGVFSLNYHKHIHTGEGGIAVTDSDQLAERLQLIRNHGEAVVGAKGTTDLVNIIGHNFRLGEIESAIGTVQLRRLPEKVASRQHAAERLTHGLQGLIGLETPTVRDGCTHVYYVYPLQLDLQILGVTRDQIVSALRAEGIPGIGAGYQNVHRQPMYQQKIAYGSSGFPWSSSICRREVDYRKGICPVAETLHDTTFLSLALCSSEYGDEDVDAVIGAFHKVWANIPHLREAGAA